MALSAPHSSYFGADTKYSIQQTISKVFNRFKDNFKFSPSLACDHLIFHPNQPAAAPPLHANTGSTLLCSGFWRVQSAILTIWFLCHSKVPRAVWTFPQLLFKGSSPLRLILPCLSRHILYLGSRPLCDEQRWQSQTLSLSLYTKVLYFAPGVRAAQ